MKRKVKLLRERQRNKNIQKLLAAWEQLKKMKKKY